MELFCGDLIQFYILEDPIWLQSCEFSLVSIFSKTFQQNLFFVNLIICFHHSSNILSKIWIFLTIFLAKTNWTLYPLSNHIDFDEKHVYLPQTQLWGVNINKFNGPYMHVILVQIIIDSSHGRNLYVLPMFKILAFKWVETMLYCFLFWKEPLVQVLIYFYFLEVPSITFWEWFSRLMKPMVSMFSPQKNWSLVQCMARSSSMYITNNKRVFIFMWH